MIIRRFVLQVQDFRGLLRCAALASSRPCPAGSPRLASGCSALYYRSPRDRRAARLISLVCIASAARLLVARCPVLSIRQSVIQHPHPGNPHGNDSMVSFLKILIGRAMYICYVRVSRPAYISSVYSCVLRFMGAYPCCYIEKRIHTLSIPHTCFWTQKAVGQKSRETLLPDGRKHLCN